MSHSLSPSEQLTHSTVRIEVETESGAATGTGFFFTFSRTNDLHVPAIVTNKHVIKNAIRGRIYITLAGTDDNPEYGTHEVCDFGNFEKFWISHPDPDVDLCAMSIAPLMKIAQERSKRLFYITLDSTLIPSDGELKDMNAIEDIIMVGYPNGLWDEINNMPILRRGITATHPCLDWNGKSEFLIDAACFPGSSGSPVFLFNAGGYSTKSKGMVLGSIRIKLLGILYAGPQHSITGEIKIVQVPTIDKPVSISTIPNNLGVIIKAKKLLDLDNIFKNMITKENNSA